MPQQLERAGRIHAAIDQLRAVIAARPDTPSGSLARAYLQLGHLLARTGRRAEAAAAWRAALSETSREDPLGIASQARTALRTGGG
jgi:hypothetical protein